MSMLDSVKDYAYSVYLLLFSLKLSSYLTDHLFRKEKMKETVVSYTSRSELDKILIEATANENWNISNTKLQILADASYHQ